jgi:hypothetical protein
MITSPEFDHLSDSVCDKCNNKAKNNSGKKKNNQIQKAEAQ